MPKKREPAEASIGKTYGRLTVLKVKRVCSKAFAECQCICGNTKLWTVLQVIKDGRVSSCGCNTKTLKKQRHKTTRTLLKGLVFGKLTVISTSVVKSVTWTKCKCECGQIKSIRATSLKQGLTKSCGCLRSHEAVKRLDEINITKHVNPSKVKVIKQGKELLEKANKDPKYRPELLEWVLDRTRLTKKYGYPALLPLSSDHLDILLPCNHSISGVWPWTSEGYPLSDTLVKKVMKDAKSESYV